MKTSLERYSNHCRTCLGELNDSKIYIYENEHISNMLIQCTSVSIVAKDGLMQYICELCRQKLLNAYNFKTKCIEVDSYLRGLLTSGNGTKSENSDSNFAPIIVEEPLITCHVCNKTFTRHTSLQIHLERHKKLKIHKCDICSKLFTTKQDLQAHYSRHTSTEIFKCHTCSRCFKSKSAIAKHVKTHSMPKQHLCPYCGKDTTDALQTHLKIHTGENLLVCPICSIGFAARASLDLHLKKHFGETPYLCSVCGLQFKTSSELNRHEVRHKGVKNSKSKVCNKFCMIPCVVHETQGPVCDFCGKKLSKNGLKKHLLKHNSDQLYHCGECMYKCHTNRDLEIHMVVHTGSYLFVCMVCGRGFNRKNNYVRHQKKH